MSKDNFDSTADLTKNKGFPSTLTITSKDEHEKPYNPFEHRTVEHPNSTIGSTIHLLKACLGTGILAMPAAFKSSGLVAGTIGTLLAGLICQHAVHMLVRVSQKLCVEAKQPSMTFAETCGAVFTYGPKPLRSWGGFIKIMTDYTMAVTYFSVCTVYTVFMASSIKEVVDVYYPEFNISIQMYCLLTLVPLVLICQIRNLKYLVPFMALANVLIVLIFGITLYYVFTDLPAISERNLVVEPTQWPKFLSIVVFAMEGVGVVMPIENEMKNPKRFLGCPGVWNVSMFIVVTLYTIVGFFGYVQFGDASKGSVTLNLPEDEFIAQSAKLLMAVAMFFSFALQFYVPMELVTRLLNKGCCSKFENLSQICIRTFLVTMTVILAVSFPNLELVIGIAGAIFFSSLGLLFPAIVDLVYHWDRGLGKFNNILFKDILIIIISLIILVSGTYVSVLDMIEDGKSHNDNSTNIDLS